MARATKLTATVSKTICDAIGEGISLEGAAELANVSASTAYEWFSRGLGEDPRGRGETKAFAEFAERLTRARAEAELREMRAIVKAAADGDWRAAAWRLERRYPKQYGRQQRVEHATADGKPLNVDLSILTDDELAILKAGLEKLGELGDDRYSEFQFAFAKGLVT
jgi:transposase